MFFFPNKLVQSTSKKDLTAADWAKQGLKRTAFATAAVGQERKRVLERPSWVPSSLKK